MTFYQWVRTLYWDLKSDINDVKRALLQRCGVSEHEYLEAECLKIMRPDLYMRVVHGDIEFRDAKGVAVREYEREERINGGN